MYFIYNKWFMNNSWKWWEWEKTLKRKSKKEQNEYLFGLTTYKKKADCFQISEGDRKQVEPSLVGKWK